MRFHDGEHTPKATEAGPSYQVHQDRLGLGVGGMGDSDTGGILLGGDAGKEIIARITGLFFERAAVPLGTGPYIFLGGGKGEAEGLGLGRNEIGVGVRGIGTQAVVEVGDVEGET